MSRLTADDPEFMSCMRTLYRIARELDAERDQMPVGSVGAERLRQLSYDIRLEVANKLEVHYGKKKETA